jgi:transcriptional regulator with GAF, ATPase, and Fis domain
MTLGGCVSENSSLLISKDILWFDVNGIKTRDLEAFLTAAATTSVNPTPLKSRIPTGPGLYLFASVTDELCESLQEYSRYCGRILAVAMGEKPPNGPECWRLLSAGATDVVVWSADEGPQTIQAMLARWCEIDRIANSQDVLDCVIGRSKVWQTVLRQIVEVACFTDSSVLIMGETGTGKELISKLIYTLDRRVSKGNLVVLDCTTIASELSGSEFFGHERGAFTNAIASRDGAFALADGGTLFLDEVGELPLRLQSELLRVIQEQKYKKVGSNTWRRTEFRLVCATNLDLTEAVAQGTFRRDLYHRIATWCVRLPALRDRREDILPLARHFLREIFQDNEAPELDPAVRDCLIVKDYPGNVRDLRNLILRIGQRHVGSGPITVGGVPAADRPDQGQFIHNWRDNNFVDAIQRALASGANLESIKSAAAETAYEVALNDEAGNAKRAAIRLGVSPRAVQAKRASRKRTQPGEEKPLPATI